MSEVITQQAALPCDTPRVLVVDDEVAVLNSMRRLIRRRKPGWTVLLASSAQNALDQLQEQAPDVLITDKQMPEIDGVNLLQQVRKKNPRALRVLLTADASPKAVMTAAGLAHLIFAKPYDPEAILSVLDRGASIQRLPVSEGLKCSLGRLKQLPVVSNTLSDLSLELARDEVSLERVSAIVETDQAMTARVLQLANSAFFGFSTEVVSIRDAVIRLGSELIRAVVLALELFHPSRQQTSRDLSRSFSIARKVAERAVELGRQLQLGRQERDAIFVAGLLHNIGALVELELHHLQPGDDLLAAIGAYLLTLWGFQPRQVELLLHMRHPSRSVEYDPALACLHQAWVEAHEGLKDDALDLEYLNRAGLHVDL